MDSKIPNIKRALFGELKKNLAKRDISLIIGARQVGKTTLMKSLQEDLEAQGKKTLYLSLDFDWDKPHFQSQTTLIKKLQLELGSEGGTVFIDEIQRKENAGLFLKGLYDAQLPYKFVVSGSGSVELKEKVHESLTGRKRLFELYPVSFEEWIHFKTQYRYENNLSDFFSVERETLELLLKEYLNFGGYPRVILEEKSDEKTKMIDEIYRSYLEKDIAYLLKIEKVEAFHSLVKILASQMGQLTNYSEISNSLGITVQTVKNYLWVLENTFIVKRVSPFFRNIRKEISKAPVIYFYDLGLRNFVLGLFGNLFSENQLGFAFQNFVFQILNASLFYTNTTLHFWRTTDKSEVDFVISRGMDVLPVEVKFQPMKKPTLKRSMHSFIHKYSPQKAFVINRELKTSLKINHTEVFFIPYWELLLSRSPFAHEEIV